MFWTLAAIAAVFAVAAAAVLAAARKKARRRDITGDGNVFAALAGEDGDAPYGFYGLPPRDGAQLQRMAREQMHRQQAEWGRDYLPGAGGGSRPGRLAGIPRALRVRR